MTRNVHVQGQQWRTSSANSAEWIEQGGKISVSSSNCTAMSGNSGEILNQANCKLGF